MSSRSVHSMQAIPRRLLTCRRYATETSGVSLPKHPPLAPQDQDGKPSTSPETSSSNATNPSSTQQDAPSPAILGNPQTLSAELKEVIKSFDAPVRFAVGYGSGVFKQAGRSSKDQPMLDFIMAVSHPTHWHDLNKLQNPDHYAWLPRILGSRFIGHVQERLGAGVWFNIDCKVAGRRIKYGVVGMNTLCRDLYDWDTLYLAGRLQKPTAMLKDNPRVRLANQVNHASAVRTALLMLPEQFTPEQLFMTVAGLSYTGDPRMAMAENPDKVKNIVTGPGQLEAFFKMYAPFLPHIQVDGQLSNRSWTQDGSPHARAELACKLPSTLRDMMYAQFVARRVVPPLSTLDKKKSSDPAELKEHWAKIVAHDDFQQAMGASLQGIVGPAAYRQSLKGAISVGPVKGVQYVWPKIQKRIWGDRK